LTRNIGDILLVTMNSLHQLHSRLKQSPWGDAGRQAVRRPARSAQYSRSTGFRRSLASTDVELARS
jgi:hypothetical protein